ncbi:MAG: hypothetical protein QNK04_24950 [Myxococcota bacterium]|nr:hypothetical protein [Myxococcota bacterium]
MQQDRFAVVAKWVLPALLPALAFLLLHARTLDHGFVWTDETALGAGTLLRPAGETLRAFAEPLHRIEKRGEAAQQRYYRPLPVAMLSLVDQRLGREPAPFRVLTLAVGALGAAAFGLFATAVLGGTGAGVFVGLFVAVHPVVIENVAWIVAMPESLSSFFVVIAVAAGLASLRPRKPGSAAALATLSVLALVLGLLAKERAVVTPALLLAGVVCLGLRAQWRQAGLLIAVQLAVLGLYTFGLRPLALDSAVLPLPPIEGSLLTQVLTGIASWPRQIGWLFAPLTSSTSDTVRVVSSLADPWLWLGLLLAAGSVAGFVFLLRQGLGAGALGLAWIWIAFAPSAGLLPLLHPSGERYLYLSAFGAALLLADLGRRLAPGRAVAVAASALLLVTLAQRSWARLPDWQSSETLFTADVARDPAYREAYFLLAAADFEAGRHAEASAHLGPLLGTGDPFAGTAGYLNWIVVAELACQNELALGRYRRILEIERKLRRENPAVTRVPTFQLCHGQALDAVGQTEAALGLYLSAARQLGPATPPVVTFMIARNQSQLGRREEALAWLERARAASHADPALVPHIRELEASLGAQGGRRTRPTRSEPEASEGRSQGEGARSP